LATAPYFFHFKAIPLSPHIFGFKRPIFTYLGSLERSWPVSRVTLETLSKGAYYSYIWNMREVLVYCREKWKKIIAYFHVLELFIAEKHDLSEKKNSVCNTPLPSQKFVSTLAQSLWKLESWNFGSRSLLGQLDVPHAQKFDLLRVPPIKIPTKKGKNLSLVKQISP
jgi:hypothetical protein